MYRYTLCLIRKADQWLLLNRQKQPAMGMWNGVGGKIEAGESPTEAVIRETFEETGLTIPDVQFAGTILLRAEETAGIYLFLADMPNEQMLTTPFATREGILDWKRLDWILDPENTGVISNLKAYLPYVLTEPSPMLHTFNYAGHQLLDHQVSPLEHVIN
ncbi:DNA mismatch repair protein MutT [Exiguobacterium sp. KRL4]|uniref:NUDIX hydrolase n=1 Tax=Exiguobacterium sp. KRL4 TaxID=1914536 RepID=UPI0008F87F3C|nr:8-oxo-dGTP diphosphatase [Exiguobacterium sp. KRL4]OIN65936.1 DNA mismatch repair protein MutT [Exiguobacterium sp. KRL4]